MPSLNYSNNNSCTHSLKLVGNNGMICSYIHLFPQSAQSRGHGNGFGGLSPQTKLQAPQIETWNTINQWSFCQFLEYQAPPHKRKAPLLKSFQQHFWVCYLFLFCPQESQSYSNETRIWILTCEAAWPAQNFRWVKMFDFRRAIVLCLRNCLLNHKMTR